MTPKSNTMKYLKLQRRKPSPTTPRSSVGTSEHVPSENEHPFVGNRRKRRVNLANKNDSPTANRIDPSPEHSNAIRPIERVLKMRKRDNQHQYLVKWANRTSWISRDQMINSYPQQAIQFFESITEFQN